MSKISNIQILDYISTVFGRSAVNLYSEMLEHRPAQYIRVNTLQTTPEKLADILAKYSIVIEYFTGLDDIYRVISDPNIFLGKTPEHLMGYYYIQSLSSMLPAFVLQPNSNDKTLDLCAAPGSKSTQLATMMLNKGTLILNEIQADRSRILIYNIERMGVVNAGIIKEKGEWLGGYYQNYFDKILVDAPCSGLGIIQKKGEINKWWTLPSAESLAELQYKLLVAAVKMLKPGGIMVYSTCTLTIEENEANINKLINNYPIELQEIDLPIPLDDAVLSYKGVSFSSNLSKTKRVLPWIHNSEGFYLAKLMKTDETEPVKSRPFKPNDIRLVPYSKIQKQTTKIIDVYGIDEVILNKYKYLITKDSILFVDGTWNDSDPSKFERIGLKFGSLDNNGQIVLHSHAAKILSQHLNRGIIELTSLADFKTYMEGGTIKAAFNGQGQVSVRYGHNIIGTAVLAQGGLKSRFPRSHRTTEMVF